MEERTESATPRRRQEVRRRGQTARSGDVNSAVALLVGVLFLRNWGGTLVTWSLELLRSTLTNLNQPDITPEVAVQGLLAFALFSSAVLGPIFAVMLVSGVVANVAQAGFLFTLQPLKPDFSRVNPLQGVKRLFSARSLVELVKSIVKILIVGYVLWRVLQGQLLTVMALPQVPWPAAIGFTVSLVFDVATWAAAVLLVLAVADYGYQRFSFERQIRMSRQEVREELKQTEGNPVIRQRVRQLQRAIAQRRMMQAVPRADVVITNPTHLAIALQYESGAMPAPRVVAKGEALIAEQIKRVAREHDVPAMENRPLARALFRSCELGDEVPGELYGAVAELLAFVYRLRAAPRPAPAPAAERA
ncbi:MAG TPA: flagellar biosynthesis protein FlhB [Chloroflexota bacterium]